MYRLESGVIPKAAACTLMCFAMLHTSSVIANDAKVSGTATYLERMALPPDAVFEATLEDISRADAKAEALGRIRIKSPGQPPIKFTITYDANRIDVSHHYAVRARIMVGDKLLFVTDSTYAFAPNRTTSVELMLRRVASTSTLETKSTASLENTYWKLIKLDGKAIVLAEQQREPHFILQIEQQRVTGFGGCNRMTGSYKLDGERISFSQLVGTMMACVQGMDVETTFYAVLGKAVRWKITDEQLQLFDDAGQSLAQFESRYMN